MTDDSATSGSVATISPSNPNCSIKDQEINLSNNTELGLVDDEKASDDKCCCDDVSQTEFYDKEDNLNKNNSNYYGSHLALHNLGEKIPSLSKEIQSKLPANEKRGEASCLVPQVGMRFSSEEEAYNFYKTYAKEIGFTVRKGKVTRLSDGTIRRRYFFCSRQGFKSIQSPNKRKKRTETRIGCNANVQIKFENGKWVIAKCFLEHNHDLERPFQNHTLTCAENFEVKWIGNTCNDATVGSRNGSTKYAILQPEDSSSNYLSNKDKNILKPEDVRNLIDCLFSEQLVNPSFLYTIQVDAESHISNFFWSDWRSRIDYNAFGDVLVLDTTVRLNNMICALFWGLNHHQECVLFGCAVLVDDTLSSLVWLLENFLKAMDNCKPKTFYTDATQVMASAVETVLSQTQHRIGVSFIYKNAGQRLAKCFEQPGFKSLFEKCVFHSQSKKEFESLWMSLLKQYNLQENTWLSSLYTSREKWSNLFSKNIFTAGIEAMLNVISNNISLFQYSTREILTMSDFFKKYVETTKQLRSQELQEDLRCKKIVSDRPRCGMEKHAEDTYTWTMFKEFEFEFYGILSLAMEEVTNSGTISMFKLIEEWHNEEYVVAFESSSYTVTCSCAMFESIGMLCRHCLKVLNAKNIFHIPSQYILKRWTKFAREGLLMESLKTDMAGKDQKGLSLYPKDLTSKALMIITKGATNDECRKIVEGHLEKASTEIDGVLRN